MDNFMESRVEECRQRIPFPVRWSELVNPVNVQSDYCSETQVNRLQGDMITRTTSHLETGTGGHNDTDQDWDQD